MTKRIGAAATTAAMLLIAGAAVQNQDPPNVAGVVVHAPSGGEGQPVQSARVEYRDDNTGEVQVKSTNSDGSFEFAAGRSGIVTISKEGFVTISVGWPPRERDRLRVELPRPAVLEGTLRNHATGTTVLNGVVTVTVDHPVSSLSDSFFTRTGAFAFRELPPGPAVVVAHAPGYEPFLSNFELRPGGVDDPGIRLRQEVKVSGRVVDGEGNENVGGAEVFFAYNDSFEAADVLESFVGGRLVTNDDGFFLVNGIVPGKTFSLHAETEDGRKSNPTDFLDGFPQGTWKKDELLKLLTR